MIANWDAPSNEEGAPTGARLRVVFLVDAISRGTGGVASVLDLARVAARQGHDVHVGVLRFDPHYRRNLHALQAPPANVRIVVHYVPGAVRRWSASGVWESGLVEARSARGHDAQRKIRGVARRAIEFVAPLVIQGRYARFDELMADADVIVKALPLSGAAIGALRHRTRAVLVQNHAGSPAAYRDHWLTAAHRPLDSDPADDLYVAFCRAFDRIVFQADAHARECASLHPTLRPCVAVLRPTTDEDAIDAARRLPTPFAPGGLAVVCVGTVQPRKAQHLAIDAFRRVAANFPGAHLHLVGSANVDPGYARRLRASVGKWFLGDRVTFHGHRDDYLRYLAHATLLLQTSEAEGVPRALREAMRASVPIVTIALPGLSELVEDRREARVVAQGDCDGLAIAISELLSSAELRTALAARARERYEMSYSVGAYERRVGGLLTEWTAHRAGE